ncbi:MAG: glutathione S-transferase N-terminal domain-containing protein [Pseudomonadota bacterium]
MTPVLYSFRRCPFAMRARLALAYAGLEVEHREILLRDKPAVMLSASPKGTVPVLVLEDRVLEESRDVMVWALERSDPKGLLLMSQKDWALVDEIDGPFKAALDRTKYHTRYGSDPRVERLKAQPTLDKLSARLSAHRFLSADAPRATDIAIFPFVRQFANIDKAQFQATTSTALQTWLEHWLESDVFAKIMVKHPIWQPA